MTDSSKFDDAHLATAKRVVLLTVFLDILGFGIIILALLTDFEVGVVRLIPMPVHLGIDVLGGLLLAASPWLFGFADRVWAPHLVFGLLEAGLALVTRTAPAGQPTRRAA